MSSPSCARKDANGIASSKAFPLLLIEYSIAAVAKFLGRCALRWLIAISVLVMNIHGFTQTQQHIEMPIGQKAFDPQQQARTTMEFPGLRAIFENGAPDNIKKLSCLFAVIYIMFVILSRAKDLLFYM